MRKTTPIIVLAAVLLAGCATGSTTPTSATATRRYERPPIHEVSEEQLSLDSRLIDAVYGQRDEFPRKPEPDSLFAMLGELGVQRENTLYIGDSDVDVFTAKNAGVDFCGVSWGFRGYDELKNAGADIIVSKPEEIAEIALK